MSVDGDLNAIVEAAAWDNGYRLKSAYGLKTVYTNQDTGAVVAVLAPEYLSEACAYDAVQAFMRPEGCNF